MSSVRVDLADAIVDLLNDGGNQFILTFVAQRKSAPLTAIELSELKDLSVLVFTGSSKLERVTRGSYGKTYKPIVAIQRLLTDETPEGNEAIVDQLEELVEQIEAVLEDEDLADLSFVGFDDEQDREAYNAEALQNLSFFTTAIQLEYTSG